jgi:hypothetical protein
MTGGGLRAEIEVTDGSACEVAVASAQGVRITSVSRGVTPDADGVTVEFTADAGADVDVADPVFDHDDTTVYRFVRDGSGDGACACELVEQRGCPVRHLEATEGRLVLRFITADLASLRAIVADLDGRFEGVRLRRLTRSCGETGDDDADLVFVDRAALTDRQQEVLRTAHEMGYFEHPREANATAVAAALDINRSTFAEHLAHAQSKVLDAVLDGPA